MRSPSVTTDTAGTSASAAVADSHGEKADHRRESAGGKAGAAASSTSVAASPPAQSSSSSAPPSSAPPAPPAAAATTTTTRQSVPSLLTSSSSVGLSSSKSLAVDVNGGAGGGADSKPKPPCIEKLEALMTSAKSQGLCITKLFGSFVPLPDTAAVDGAATAGADAPAGGQSCILPQLTLENTAQSSGRNGSIVSADNMSRSLSPTTARRTSGRRTSAAMADGQPTASGAAVISSSSVSPRKNNDRRASTGTNRRRSSAAAGGKAAPCVHAAPVEVSAIGRAALAKGLTILASRRDKEVQFSEEEVDQILQHLDEDNSGEIDMWEFAAFCLRIPSVTWKAERSRRGVRSCNDEEAIMKAAKAIHAELVSGLNRGTSSKSFDTASIDEEEDSSSAAGLPVDEREVIEIGELLKKANKLFWRTRENLEYAIYENSRGLISISTHHLELGLVFPPLLIEMHKLPVVVVREGITGRLADLERKKKEETNVPDLDEETKKVLLEQARTEVICDFLEARLQLPSGHAATATSTSPTTTSASSPSPRSSSSPRSASVAVVSTTHLPIADHHLQSDHPSTNSGSNTGTTPDEGSGPGPVSPVHVPTAEERAALVLKHQPYLVNLHGDEFDWTDLMFVSELGKGFRLQPEHKFTGREGGGRKMSGFQAFTELNEKFQEDRAQSKRLSLRAASTSAQAVGIMLAYESVKTKKQNEGTGVNELQNGSRKEGRRAQTFTVGQVNSPAHLKMLSELQVLQEGSKKVEGDGAKLSPRSPRRLEPLASARESVSSASDDLSKSNGSHAAPPHRESVRHTGGLVAGDAVVVNGTKSRGNSISKSSGAGTTMLQSASTPLL